MLPSLTGLSHEELTSWLKEQGEPAFRANQILDWMWKKKADSIDAMSNLPAALREKLASSFRLSSLTHTHTQGSADTTTDAMSKVS